MVFDTELLGMALLTISMGTAYPFVVWYCTYRWGRRGLWTSWLATSAVVVAQGLVRNHFAAVAANAPDVWRQDLLNLLIFGSWAIVSFGAAAWVVGPRLRLNDDRRLRGSTVVRGLMAFCGVTLVWAVVANAFLGG
jgi:hypothetical protein